MTRRRFIRFRNLIRRVLDAITIPVWLPDWKGQRHDRPQ